MNKHCGNRTSGTAFQRVVWAAWEHVGGRVKVTAGDAAGQVPPPALRIGVHLCDVAHNDFPVPPSGKTRSLTPDLWTKTTDSLPKALALRLLARVSMLDPPAQHFNFCRAPSFAGLLLCHGGRKVDDRFAGITSQGTAYFYDRGCPRFVTKSSYLLLALSPLSSSSDHVCAFALFNPIYLFALFNPNP